MRIMVLADEPDKKMWDHPDRELLAGLDLVLSCGDLPGEYLSFITCFTKAPVLYVKGNHDARYGQKPPEGCVCVDGDLYVYKGVRILGLGGSIRYGRFGECMYSEAEMRRRIRRLRFKLWRRGGFDILLAHSPARDIGDGADKAHRGFECFKPLINKYRPAYMFHGHVHKSYVYDFVSKRSYGVTEVINAAGVTVIDAEFPGENSNINIPAR